MKNGCMFSPRKLAQLNRADKELKECPLAKLKQGIEYI
jgi:hypothetical protein